MVFNRFAEDLLLLIVSKHHGSAHVLVRVGTVRFLLTKERQNNFLFMAVVINKKIMHYRRVILQFLYCSTFSWVRKLSSVPGPEPAASLSRSTERTHFMSVFPDIARDILFDTSSQVGPESIE
jgi:hypothetical protein